MKYIFWNKPGCMVLLVFVMLFNRVPRVFAQTSSLKIMSYNLNFATEPVSGKAEMVSLANYLKNNGVEIVALTEAVSIEDDCSGCDHSDEQSLFDELTRIGYPMNGDFWQINSISNASKKTRYYRAILSRYPIENYSNVVKQPGVWGLQTISINHPTLGRIRFFDNHPIPNTMCKDASGNSIYCPAIAVDDLLAYANTFSEPSVLMGDFNLTMANPAHVPSLNKILAEYNEACTTQMSPTCADTVTSSTENYAIDHIFVEKNRGLNTINASVDQSYTWSDHFPVLATISNQPSNSSPIGYLDSASCTSFSGWTCDADKFSQALTVQFYDGTTLIGQTTANQVRVDLAPICGGTNNHGYTFIVPATLKDGRSHSIAAYAVNILSSGSAGGGTTQLTNSPKTITCAAPTPTRTPTAIPTKTPTPTPTIIPIPGDNNPKDGRISSTELYAILRSYYTNVASYDTNGDGLLNSFDFRFIRPYIY